MANVSEPFAIDPELARQALVLADAGARQVLVMRSDAGQGDLHLALFSGDDPAAGELPEATDLDAVVAYMERRLIADRWEDDPDAIVPALGLSRRHITRVKAFECLHAGVDSYAAILLRRKFDGATRSYGSHRFAQLTPQGGGLALISAASGWRGDQDYVAAMMVPAALQYVLLEAGALPRELMVSSGFRLLNGAWDYPPAA